MKNRISAKKIIITAVSVFALLSIMACRSVETENNAGGPSGPGVESAGTEKDDGTITDRSMKITVGETTLTATLEDNSSAEALVEKLQEGDLTLDLADYGNMEKVGGLGFSLPRNDTQIRTQAGDLILYQGDAFVIYYDTNSWNFTKLGKIDDVTGEELKEILGSGDVTVVLSLN